MYHNGQNYEITPFFNGFCLRLQPFLDINPRVTDPDPAKVTDPCGSGSTTLLRKKRVFAYLL
jgi:hypothetical protein